MIRLFDNLYLDVVEQEGSREYRYIEYNICLDNSCDDENIVRIENCDWEEGTYKVSYGTMKEAVKAACTYKINKLVESSQNRNIDLERLKKEIDKCSQLVNSIPEWI